MQLDKEMKIRKEKEIRKKDYNVLFFVSVDESYIYCKGIGLKILKY